MLINLRNSFQVLAVGAAALLATACDSNGNGGGTMNPPPPPPAMASFDVTVTNLSNANRCLR